jgi:hypothetical protein
LILSALSPPAAAGDPATATAPATNTSPVMPFLGAAPDNATLKAALIGDISRFPPGERVALMEITLLCELDRGGLSRRKIFLPWQKRCRATEAIWTGKYRRTAAPRAIDDQMRLYFARRHSLWQTVSNYIDARDAIDLKRRQHKNTRQDVETAVRLRKEIAVKSTEVLNFIFALRDLANKPRR